jgi:hypothetical protein
LNTGGRYDFGIDSWAATNIANAPTARYSHTAVGTGSEMIVWGGIDDVSPFNTGGRYEPGADTWTATSTTKAPAGRYAHSAVWTGNEMIVWGGVDVDGNLLKTGGRYCAESGAASPTPTTTPTATATPSATATPTESPTATPSPSVTPSPTSCWVSSETCGTVVNLPTDFFVDASGVVDAGTLDGSDFTVNGMPADDAILLSGGHRMLFTFNTSPVIKGINTMHIPAGAFNCFETGPVAEFTCTFQGLMQSPTPTPSATSTATPTATATATLSPRPTPSPRSRPTPAPRP